MVVSVNSNITLPDVSNVDGCEFCILNKTEMLSFRVLF